MRQTTRREVMALMSGGLAGATLGGDAFAQGAPKRGGILPHLGAGQPVKP
jgi:peptide/nickel transport system permease protein/peptide/nickel transport system substrate-binding protein